VIGFDAAPAAETKRIAETTRAACNLIFVMTLV